MIRYLDKDIQITGWPAAHARFAARYAHLGFSIAPRTLELMRDIVGQGELAHLTTERVWVEIEKALGERDPQVFITSLRDNPRAALLFWDDAQRLQVRAQAEVFIQTGQSVAKEWARVPDPQRLSYGTTPRPGTPIMDGLDYDKPALQSAFAVLYCRVMALDLVHLGARHRRAGFTRGRDWAGQWLSP